MASSITVNDILDDARGRHPAFANLAIAEGSFVNAANQRQRSLMLQFGGAVDGLMSSSVDIATTIANNLVGQSNGVPTFVTTYQDGWATHHTANGVPYWDFTEPKIAGDPFGQNGGTPGFPLPDDFLKLVRATCTYSDSRIGPVDIVAESERLAPLRLARPAAFLSGNRLVPVRPLATGNSGDAWAANIASVQLSYVSLPRLTALVSQIAVPAALVEALVTGMVEYLAMLTPGLASIERNAFAAAARRAEENLDELSVDVVGAASTSRVRFVR